MALMDKSDLASGIFVDSHLKHLIHWIMKFSQLKNYGLEEHLSIDYDPT